MPGFCFGEPGGGQSQLNGSNEIAFCLFLVHIFYIGTYNEGASYRILQAKMLDIAQHFDR